MDKVKKGIITLINTVTLVLLITILITSFLFTNFVWNSLRGWQEALLVLIIFTLLFVIFNKLKMLSNQILTKIALLNALLIIGLSIYVFVSIQIKPAFDTYYCFAGANEYLNHHFDWNQINPGIKHYLFYRCTNLLPLTYLEVFLQGILQFLGITNLHTMYQLLCGLNFVMLWMTIYLVYRLIQRRFSQYLATGFTLLILLFWPFFVILDMFYTDWPAMLMTVGILVNYDAFLHIRRQRLKRVILIIICAVLGTLMKSNVLIVLLAIIIHYWLRTSSFKNGLFWH